MTGVQTCALPIFVRRVAAAQRDGVREVPIGNTAVSRDFLHVEDVVRAYLALVEDGLPGEVYNVASGRATTIGDLASQVAAALGADVTFVPDPGLTRPVDLPHLAGRITRIRDDAGWTPQLTVADMIRDVVAAGTG